MRFMGASGEKVSRAARVEGDASSRMSETHLEDPSSGVKCPAAPTHFSEPDCEHNWQWVAYSTDLMEALFRCTRCGREVVQ